MGLDVVERAVGRDRKVDVVAPTFRLTPRVDDHAVGEGCEARTEVNLVRDDQLRAQDPQAAQDEQQRHEPVRRPHEDQLRSVAQQRDERLGDQQDRVDAAGAVPGKRRREHAIREHLALGRRPEALAHRQDEHVAQPG
jgi:hypothetical protein